jgi:hypothetical protein
MNCIDLILRRLLNAALVSLLFGTPTLGEPMLLATLRMHGGGCCTSAPVGPRLAIGFHAGGLNVAWSFFATPDDVGRTISVPGELLADFDTVLTYPGTDNSGAMTYNAEVGSIFSSGLTNGTQMDRAMIDRIAPVLGLNFSGYNISNLTATVDELVFSGPPGPVTNQGKWSVRIFGVPIPALPGDFNTNGTVDAADYVVWRNRVLDNDLMPNGVGSGVFAGRAVVADYDWWRSHFGSQAVLSAVSVPEPPCWCLWICAALGSSRRYRRPHSGTISSRPNL